jgi:hypothetical protein
MVRPSVRTAPRRPSLTCLHCSQLYLTGPRSSLGSSPGAGEARGGERGSVSVRGTRRSSRSAKPAAQIFPGPLCRYRPRMTLRSSGLCCIWFGLRSVAETVSGSPGETSLPPGHSWRVRTTVEWSIASRMDPLPTSCASHVSPRRREVGGYAAWPSRAPRGWIPPCEGILRDLRRAPPRDRSRSAVSGPEWRDHAHRSMLRSRVAVH